MSWSLEIRNGDIPLHGANLSQVVGTQKLVQDLRLALLEQRGHDPSHPTYGSLLDGGRDQDGNDVPSLVGSSNLEYVAMRVDAEIRRIAAEQQRRQLERAQQDRYTYGESTLDNGELLVNVTAIRMVQVQDTLMVRVELATGDGRSIELDVPVSDTPLVTT